MKAIRNGDWVLLDEINLALAETLECLSGVLESSAGSVVLLDRGLVLGPPQHHLLPNQGLECCDFFFCRDLEPIVRHKDFHIFACMHPATDVGKKVLPPGICNRSVLAVASGWHRAGGLGNALAACIFCLTILFVLYSPSRFTEVFVDELDDTGDLKTLVVHYLQGLSPAAAVVDGIVR